MKPARGRKVENGWRAAHLNDHGAEGTGVRRLLGNPQSISGLGCFSDDKFVRFDAETRNETGCIGATRFPHHLGGGNPQQRRFGSQREPGKGQGESGGSRAIADSLGMQFHEAGERHAAAKCCIKTVNASACHRLTQTRDDFRRQGGAINAVALR